MEHQEYLSLIAELAVAFAGFTGIVGVFRFQAGKWQEFEIANFATMLRASLSALFVSLLPYLLFQLTGNQPISWQIAAAIVALIMSLNLVAFGVKAGLARGNRTHRLMFPIGVVICLVNLVAAFGLLTASKTVLVAVTWQLLVSAHNFVLLISEPVINPGSGSAGVTEAGEAQKRG